MSDRICELIHLIKGERETIDIISNKKALAEQELEMLLREKCEAYKELCDVIVNRQNSSFEGDRNKRIGMEIAREILKNWLIKKYCKE